MEGFKTEDRNRHLLRVGYVYLYGGWILKPIGLERLFNELDADWRFAEWPVHLEDASIKAIQRDNLELDDVAKDQHYHFRVDSWEEYERIESSLKKEIPDSRRNKKYIVSRQGDLTRRFLDYRNIRVLNEFCNSPSPTSIWEKVRLIERWIDGCDFAVIDITEAVMRSDDKSWETMKLLAECLDKDNTIFYLCEIARSEAFPIELLRKLREKWEENLKVLRSTCKVVEMDPASRIDSLENMKKITPQTFAQLDKCYNKCLREFLMEQVNVYQKK